MPFQKMNQKKILYLNSNDAIKTTNAGGKYSDFTWNIPEINLNDWGELQIGSLASNGANATAIYTTRVKNINCSSKDVYDSSSGPTVLCSLLWNNFNALFRDDYGIMLPPQSINSIVLNISDDITDRNSGIATSVKFIICLVITELDPAVVNYDENVSRNIGQRMISNLPTV
jgi:hypothetical protein